MRKKTPTRKMKKIITYALGLLLVYTCFITFLPTTVHATEPTVVRVDPSSQIVSAGETFQVDIYCVPGQPIKSFELKVSFDPTLLQANSITEGDIFEGHTTFFNEGIINNAAGTIINIYDLIIGPESTSDPGTLLTLSFTAKSLSGTSTIDLYEVGVTDAAGYVTITVSDGGVTILGENQPPDCSNLSPSNGSTTVSIGVSSLSLSIQDPEGDLFNWTIMTSPNIGSSSGINVINGTKTCSISGLSYATTYNWYVHCIDIGSGHWHNHSYWFTTENNPSQGGGGGGGSGGEEPSNPQEENTPPESPIKPSGPEFIELDVSYIFTSATFDQDGDTIRLLFDWDDGTTSSWSNFVPSNQSVEFTHTWTSIATYTVRVIAQDEHGLNSSWSVPLSVTVSQVTSEEILPIPDISGPENTNANQTVIFDASGSIDPNHIIASYFWDFDDGTTGTGVNPTHSFSKPGQYTVTLTITDINGNKYTKTFIITVSAESGGSSITQITNSPLFIGVIGGILALFAILVVIFRNSIHNVFSNILIANREKKLDRLNIKINQFSQTIEETSTADQYSITNDNNKRSLSSDESIEEKIDEVLFSKTEKKLMNNNESLYVFFMF